MINFTAAILATPSLFLGGIFRGAWLKKILKLKGEVLFLLIYSAYHHSVVTHDELLPPYVTSGQSEWELAPGSIKGGASHTCYWATSDEGPSCRFPLVAISG